MGRARTVAIGHRWLYRLLHRDFDVCSGSSGNQSNSTVCRSPRFAWEVGARCGRYGFSGGLERTMVTDLTGKLPKGTRRIRIVNNLKIYWDAIRIDQTPEVRDVRVAQVPLAKAALDFVGYPREIRLKPV